MSYHITTDGTLFRLEQGRREGEDAFDASGELFWVYARTGAPVTDGALINKLWNIYTG